MRFTLFILAGWLVYMFFSNQWYLFVSGWFMSVTMIFGSFIAGASSEGGGAFAFPVMTLIYRISPEVARNFSLAIQSVGMTAASVFIFKKKILVEKKYLVLSSIGGAFGVVLGTLYVVPFVSPSYVKMLFFSFWLSFAFVLFYLNHIKKREVFKDILNLKKTDKFLLMSTGALGGILTSIIGSGIDIFTFSFVTLRYDLSEKVATPTSVIIMAINSIVGFALHGLVLGDFGNEEYMYWIVCIPVVIFGAPLGAYVINVIKRIYIAEFLYLVIIGQFVGACYIIRPSGQLLIFTIAVFFTGLFIFSMFSKNVILREFINTGLYKKDRR